jgi:CheY-like chemotaxis protein
LDEQVVVGVFNSSQDTIDMLRELFEHHGMVVVTTYTNQLRDAETDLEALMRQHHPDVIVYDISPPYEPNWRLMQHIRAAPVCAGVPFVLTTTNAVQVKKIASTSDEILEIIGKPYDLGQVLEAARRAVERRRGLKPQ